MQPLIVETQVEIIVIAILPVEFQTDYFRHVQYPTHAGNYTQGDNAQQQKLLPS
jgi:hypothetical protein